jgi:hypothetical protein
VKGDSKDKKIIVKNKKIMDDFKKSSPAGGFKTSILNKVIIK